MHTYALANMWRSKDSFVELVLAFTFNCVLEIIFFFKVHVSQSLCPLSQVRDPRSAAHYQ